MEISQGNYVCLNLKCHVFHFIFSLFPSTKLENKSEEQVLPRERTGTTGRVEKRGRRVAMVQKKMCIHVCKCKMIPVETIPGIIGVGNKGEL
jgi:hypothetical protein